jgi:hypothetical protein
VQLWERAWLYALVTGVIYAVLQYIVDGFSNPVAALAGGLLFGVILTLAMRWISAPPESSR